MWSALGLLAALLPSIEAHIPRRALDKPDLQLVQLKSLSNNHGYHHESMSTDVANSLHKRAKIPLKILPIGDSITQGYRSSDSNGYRLDLFNDLANTGYQITFVGMVNFLYIFVCVCADC